MTRGSGTGREQSAGLDLRLAPVAVAGWLGAWCGTSGRPAVAAIAAALGVALLMVGTLLCRSVLVVAAAVAVLAVVLVGLMHEHRLATGPAARLAAERASVSAVLVTSADPTVRAAGPVRPESLAVRATLVAVDGRGAAWRQRVPVLVLVSGGQVGPWRSAPVGTRWLVDARLDQADPGAGEAAVLRVRRAEIMAPPGFGLRLVERVRAGLRSAVDARGPDVRGLVPALVLGDTSRLPPDLVESFRIAGLTHLTAVSGANLTLLLAFLLIAARWAGARGWWLRGIGLLGVVVFVALCRTEPSVLRAAAMGLVALAALGLGGVQAGIRHLCVAVLILVLLDPQLSRAYGFALSVLASAGIIAWANRWATALGGWLPRVVAEAVSVPLAAQLATTPVVAQLSGTVSVVGLLANALAGPFVGPATVLGFAAAGLSLITPTGAAVAGFAAAWAAQPIVWVARLAARLPGASLTWPTSPVALIVLTVMSILLGVGMIHLLTRRRISLVVALVMLVALVRPPGQPGWPPPGWVLVACDVGQGDGLVVALGRRQALVVDTGPDPPAIRRCLDRLGVEEVPLLVLTHFHADHVDGLTGVLATARVDRLWVSPLASPSGAAETVRRLAADHGVPVEVPSIGSSGQLGPASWSVLGPRSAPKSTVPAPGNDPADSAGPASPSVGGGSSAAETGVDSETQNNSSLVIAVEVRGIRVLLTGDVEPPGQADLVAAGVDLRSDVLKVPHHGSARQDPRFLAATRPRFAIASAGMHNDYGHPAPRTVSALVALGATVLRTDTEGSIAIVPHGGGQLVAVAQRDPALTAGRR